MFVGETRDHDVIGFHNWIQFYLQEKRGNIDYRGFFRRGTVCENNLMFKGFGYIYILYLYLPKNTVFSDIWIKKCFHLELSPGGWAGGMEKLSTPYLRNCEM